MPFAIIISVLYMKILYGFELYMDVLPFTLLQKHTLFNVYILNIQYLFRKNVKKWVISEIKHQEFL